MNSSKQLLKELKELASISQSTLDSKDRMRIPRIWDYPVYGATERESSNITFPIPSKIEEPVEETHIPAPNPGNRKLLLD